jgi:hypothetical protein
MAFRLDMSRPEKLDFRLKGMCRLPCYRAAPPSTLEVRDGLQNRTLVRDRHMVHIADGLRSPDIVKQLMCCALQPACGGCSGHTAREFQAQSGQRTM